MEYDFDELLMPIRESSVKDLRDLDKLENHIIPALGLNHESGVLFAPHLQPYTGKGLRIWQYPNQFGPYLKFLSVLRIKSYCEIGVRHGGSFITTVEYLTRMAQEDMGSREEFWYADAVDLNDAPMLREYCEYNPKCRFLVADSKSQEAHDFLGQRLDYDLVMIDGDHEAEGVRADVEFIGPKAKILALNDTHDDGWDGVEILWKQIKSAHSFAVEFPAQDPGVLAEYGRHSGFGVVSDRWLLCAK